MADDFRDPRDKADARWRDRFVRRDDAVDPEQLLANPKNPRYHPSRQQKAMFEVLNQLGWIGEVKVNVNTDRVIDGHLRVNLAISHRQTVPVAYYDLTEKEEDRAVAVYDALSRQAVYDADLYADLAAAWDDPSEGIAKLLDEMMPKSAPEPANDSTADAGEDETMDMTDVTYGMVGWSETKVRCTGDEIGDLTRAHASYRAENNGKDDGFIAWLLRSLPA